MMMDHRMARSIFIIGRMVTMLLFGVTDDVGRRNNGSGRQGIMRHRRRFNAAKRQSNR